MRKKNEKMSKSHFVGFKKSLTLPPPRDGCVTLFYRNSPHPYSQIKIVTGPYNSINSCMLSFHLYIPHLTPFDTFFIAVYSRLNLNCLLPETILAINVSMSKQFHDSWICALSDEANSVLKILNQFN